MIVFKKDYIPQYDYDLGTLYVPDSIYGNKRCWFKRVPVRDGEWIEAPIPQLKNNIMCIERFE